MKKSIFLVVFVFAYLLANAQTQTTIGKFIIVEANINGLDYSEHYRNKKGFIALFVDADKDPCLANVMPVGDSQSYGKIYSLKYQGTEETNTRYETHYYTFNWEYENTYDSKTGICAVELVLIKKPHAITFELTMSERGRDTNIYKGYVDGSLNLDVF